MQGDYRSMEDAALASFREKAPLVDLDELTSTIVEKMLTSKLRQETESVWIFNSFIDPDRELDENETDSDLDVVLLVPDWDLPVIDSGVAVIAPQAETPKAYEKHGGTLDWKSKDGKWTSAETAWERIPEHVQETFLRSLQFGFYADHSDRASKTIRVYDLTIVNSQQFVYDSEAFRLCIWENGCE